MSVKLTIDFEESVDTPEDVTAEFAIDVLGQVSVDAAKAIRGGEEGGTVDVVTPGGTAMSVSWELWFE